jgi:hypothetical protein
MTRQWRKKWPVTPNGKSGAPPSPSSQSVLPHKEDQQTKNTGEKIGMENREDTGALIHAYVRAKWLDKGNESQILQLSRQLGREVLQRINALGFDAEKLLEVPADEALSRLQTLENEALHEDAGVGNANRAGQWKDRRWPQGNAPRSAPGGQGRR